MDLIREKINQAVGILNELDIDLWMIFCRESDMMADPAADLVVGNKVVWQSAFFIPRSEPTLAVIGNYDRALFEKSGRFDRVIPYTQNCGREIRQAIEHYHPARLALNFSTNDIAADGLSHGMYLLLLEYLKDTPYTDRIISSEKIVSLLRGRKTAREIDHLIHAAILANDCWKHVLGRIKPGLTEIEIARLIDDTINDMGAVNSFDTIVNAGAKSSPGHGRPTEAALAPGDLLHVDFGARVDGFCSDIQRLAYFRRPEETSPPDKLTRAFNMIKTVIDKTSTLYRPGAVGHEIDAVARRLLTEQGYDEYQHALGHQIGRSVHDGAALVGPPWPRYGSTTAIPLEPNNVFTVELGIELADIGYVGLEEDLVVTPEGGQFLCSRQTELPVL